MPTLKQPLAPDLRRPWAWVVGCLIGMVSATPAQPGRFNDPSTGKFVPIPVQAYDWTRHFRIGALVGLNISADFEMKGTFTISGNDPARGIYDDGYVRTDETGNASGYTSYWGYNNPSQYDAAAQTLKMTASSGFTAAGSAQVDAEAMLGFDMVYGANHWYWKHARVGWDFGFGLLPISISDRNPLSGTVNRSTYTFHTGGIVVPDAPYQGGPSGLGPLIPDTPDPNPVQTISGGTITGEHSLEVNLYTLRWGPAFNWDLTEKIGVTLGAGPALGIVSGSYKYNELITSGDTSVRNRGTIDSTEVVLGGYVDATVMYHVQDGDKYADIYLGLQFMTLGDATIGGGGREGRLNLGGQVYLSAGINWPF